MCELDVLARTRHGGCGGSRAGRPEELARGTGGRNGRETAGAGEARRWATAGQRRRGGVLVWRLAACKSTADQKRWRRHSARSSRLPTLPPVAHVKSRRRHTGRTAEGHNARRVWLPCSANAWAMHGGSAIGTRKRKRQRRCSNVRRRL